MDLQSLINLDDVERAARRRLPKVIYDSIAGGSGDELTMRTNRTAMERIRLRPKALSDSRDRDLTTRVFGEEISLPVLLGPTGFQRMSHRLAELATARGAGEAGTGFVLATSTSYRMEDVAAEATGPRWFQLYPPADRTAVEDLLRRAKDSEYTTLCVTIDTPMFGLRERDKRNRLTIPLKLRPSLVLSCATRPRWGWDFARGSVGRIKTHTRVPMSIKEAGRVIARHNVIITYDDLDWIRERWPGKLVVKGVMRGEDCQTMLAHGVDGFVVSNHGGRQLDSAPPTIEVLPEIVEAVGSQAEVFVDGGFRRGVDVVKARAIGAKAVLIGRPYVYGLAAGGQAGVTRVIDILRQEILTTIGLLGCPSVDDLDPSYLWRSPN